MITRLLTLCLLIVVFGCSPKKESAPKHEPAVAENDYPDFEVVLQSGDTVRTKDLRGNNVLIFFSPDCSHCHDEAEAISARLKDFEHYTLWFVSSRDMGEIRAFAKKFSLDTVANIRFAWAPTEPVLTFYGPIQTPSTYIYEEGKLKRSFSGPTPIDSLVNAL